MGLGCGEVWWDNSLRQTCYEAIPILLVLFMTASWDTLYSTLVMYGDIGNAVKIFEIALQYKYVLSS